MDEIGMSDANVEDLNGTKWTYAVKNSFIHFIIGDDMFDKSWKELGVREYADRISLVK